VFAASNAVGTAARSIAANASCTIREVVKVIHRPEARGGVLCLKYPRVSQDPDVRRRSKCR
jgi:hypothetical protein